MGNVLGWISEEKEWEKFLSNRWPSPDHNSNSLKVLVNRVHLMTCLYVSLFIKEDKIPKFLNWAGKSRIWARYKATWSNKERATPCLELTLEGKQLQSGEHPGHNSLTLRRQLTSHDSSLESRRGFRCSGLLLSSQQWHSDLFHRPYRMSSPTKEQFKERKARTNASRQTRAQ